MKLLTNHFITNVNESCSTDYYSMHIKRKRLLRDPIGELTYTVIRELTNFENSFLHWYWYYMR